MDPCINSNIYKCGLSRADDYLVGAKTANLVNYPCWTERIVRKAQGVSSREKINRKLSCLRIRLCSQTHVRKANPFNDDGFIISIAGNTNHTNWGEWSNSNCAGKCAKACTCTLSAGQKQKYCQRKCGKFFHL